MATSVTQDGIWFDKWRYDDAERLYHEKLAQAKCGGDIVDRKVLPPSGLVSEIARARQQIQKSLNGSEPSQSTFDDNTQKRMDRIEAENRDLRKVTQDLRSLVLKLEGRVAALERNLGTAQICPGGTAGSAPKQDESEEDDFELFGEDEVDEEAEELKQQRIKQYQAKKATKTQVVAKSNIIMDVKPWDDETDMKVLENCVRSIEMDGLLWGVSKLVPVGYGIKKMQISCVIEDDKVSVDDLEEKITAFEDYIQSMDIAAFNKI